MKQNHDRQPKNRLCALVSFLFVLAAASTPTAAEQWSEIPFPLRETVTGISFITPETGYVVTAGAKYARTYNAGRLWKAYTIHKDDPPFEDVFFLNRDTGLICGRQGLICRTTDGCKTWVRTFWGDTTIWFTSVAMLGGGAAVAIGLIPGDMLTGVAFRSSDAALNWTKLPDMGYGYGELFYRKGDPLCFQAWGKLNYSLDAGKTWSSLNTGAGKVGRAAAFYGQTGVICGNLAMIAYSTDRGRNWQMASPSVENVHFTSVALLDEKTGYIAGTGGTVMKTVNGGKTWLAEAAMNDPVDLACMKLVADQLYIGGADGVILRKKVKE